MSRRGAWVFALLLVWCAPAPGWIAQESEAEGTQAGPSHRQLLDSIRKDLVELRLEEVLAAIEVLLGDPGMSKADRVEALVLRAQAHAVIGDFDAAEQGYRDILRARPGYRPETGLTPTKAMERFHEVRGEMVGTVRVTLDPAEALVTVDGQRVLPGHDGELAVLSGERVIRAEAPGFDPEQRVLQIEAGQEFPLRIQLLPNARDVIVRTRPTGVSVLLDGVEVGETVLEPDQQLGLGPPVAALRLDNVALGEHVFELRKPCFAPARLEQMLTVDLLERTPMVLDAVTMEPSFSHIRILGEPADAEVRLDGEPAGSLPLAPRQLCPGTVEVEVRAGRRVVWRSLETLQEDRETLVEVRPRPNAALLGADEWPAALSRFGSAFSTVPGPPLPVGGDLTQAGDWAAANLPPGTDLALAVLPPASEAGRERWVLFSPVLRTVEILEVPPEHLLRPTWHRPVWGLFVADSEIGGPAVVVGVPDGGAASSAGVQVGDRVLEVSGRPVEHAGAVRQALAEQPAGIAVKLTLQTAAGETREVELTGKRSPSLLRASERHGPAAVLAAWARVDETAYPDRAPAARANLALLVAESGNPALAVEHWRRVRWGDREGIGDGTRQYYLARDLLAAGQDSEAIEAFRRAIGSTATAFDDEGPAVAPAARDHLADLGVSADSLSSDQR